MQRVAACQMIVTCVLWLIVTDGVGLVSWAASVRSVKAIYGNFRQPGCQAGQKLFIQVI